MEQQWFSYAAATCSAVLLYMLLSRFQVVSGFISEAFSFISPVIIGAVFAYLMNPIAAFAERVFRKYIKKEGLCHILSVVFAVIITLLAVVLIIVAVVPSVASNFVTLASNSDKYVSVLDRYFTNLQTFFSGTGTNINDLTHNLEGVIKKVMSLLPGSLSTILRTSISVGSTVANVAISFVIAIYFLMDKGRILKAIDRLRQAALSSHVYRRNTDFFSHCNHIFMQYIGCNLMDGLIIGAANAVFMLLLQMPYVALISVFVGVTNLIPTFGPFIGGAIGAFILVINKPIMALWFLIFTAVLQTLDGYVIKPKLFGASLGIPAVVTLISIILGGKLCGILGILLAIPVVSILLDLYKDSFLPWLETRGEREE